MSEVSGETGPSSTLDTVVQNEYPVSLALSRSLLTSAQTERLTHRSKEQQLLSLLFLLRLSLRLALLTI
jgi:hypothetical protein